MSADFEEFLSQFQITERLDGDAAICICPAHNDKSGELIIEKDPDGTIKFHCKQGCKEAEIVQAALKRKKQMPRKLSEVTKRPVSWLTPYYLPQGQIIIMAGAGSAGKSTVWANLGAAITTGKPSLFDEAACVPFPTDRKPGTVLFLSGEDTAAEIVREKFEQAGADLNMVYVYDLDDGSKLDSLTFNSPGLDSLIARIRPTLCVFDPIQQFIPEDVQLSSRNQMRRCFRNLASLGKKYGTTMLLIAHTNKREAVWGRNRLADSADLFDIARSVLMMGYADEKRRVRYIAQEKNNYSERGKTILFTIDGNGAHFAGLSNKTDQDYITDAARTARSSPAVQEARDIILQCLEGGNEKEVGILDAELAGYGISSISARRAKDALKAENKVKVQSHGFGKEKKWTISLV